MSKEQEVKEVKKFKLFTVDHAKNVLSVLFIIIVVFGAGVMTGWFMRSSDISRIHGEANTIAQQMLKTEE